MNCRTTFFHDPDEHSSDPYTAWGFTIEFDAMTVRGPAPGVIVENARAVGVASIVNWCGDHGADAEITEGHERELVRWFNWLIENDHVIFAVLQERCVEAFWTQQHDYHEAG